MSIWKKVGSGFDRIVYALATLAGALIMLTVFLVCGDIGAKIVFGRSLPWVAEIVEHSLLWLTFLGTTWVLKRNAHIKMDMVVDQLSPRRQSILNLITSSLGAIVCLILAWFSSRVTWQHFQTGYKLLTSMVTPAALINFIIPVGFFLLTIQFVRRGFEYLNRYNAIKNDNQTTNR
jgi:TRAP-type C4-dicarboxylate transport system permease small subunit